MIRYATPFKLAIASVFVVGCATTPSTFEPSNMAEKFEVKNLTVNSIASEARACLGYEIQNQMLAAIQKDFPVRSGFSIVRNPNSSQFVYFFASSMACIPLSKQGFPILAAEALTETVVPIGVPNDVKLDWDKKIVARIASRGTARVLYVYPNGNAQSAVYWVKPDEQGAIHYGTDFRRAGQFQAADYDFQFTHPSLSGTTTITYQNGTMFRKGFLQHRLAASNTQSPSSTPIPTRATPLPR